MGKQAFFRQGLVLAAGLSLFVLAGAAAVDAGTPDNRLSQAETASTLPEVWQPTTEADQAQIWQVVLQSPLGVAALNQLAIEGFISPLCDKTLYTHETYESFQTLMQVQCPTPRGVSTARAYDEMRITFNRFEDTITDFSVERIYTD